MRAAGTARLLETGLVLGLLAGTILHTLHDVRRRRLCQRELTLAWLESRTDPLTGLANRAEVQDRLTGHEYPRPVVMLALLDLDGFKQVNDTYGHETGDDLLTVIAERLIHATVNDRDVDGRIVPARLAGDEFVLLWLRLPADPVTHVERILHEITEPVHVPGGRLPLGISAGIALAGTHLHGTGLLRAADAAMYQAKKHDRPGTPGNDSAATTSGQYGQDAGSVRVRLWTSDQPPRPQQVAGKTRAHGQDRRTTRADRPGDGSPPPAHPSALNV